MLPPTPLVNWLERDDRETARRDILIQWQHTSQDDYAYHSLTSLHPHSFSNPLHIFILGTMGWVLNYSNVGQHLATTIELLYFFFYK